MNLSELLKTKRQELKLSLDDIFQKTGISPKHISALENASYHELPAPVYTECYLKKLAALYVLDSEDLISSYREERISKNPFADVTRLQPQAMSTSVHEHFTPKRLAVYVSTALFSIAASYMIWQILSITAAPKLTLDSPSDGQQLTANFITVEGHTEAGATVTINNQTIPVNNDGSFQQSLYITPGENYILVKAENRFKRQREITRRIILSQSEQQQVLGATDEKPAQ